MSRNRSALARVK